MNAEVAGTAAASLIAALTGVGAFISAARSRKSTDELAERQAEAEQKQEAVEVAVELERAEREGWVQLIRELREQNTLQSGENRTLRDRTSEVESQLRHSKADYERQIDKLEGDFKVAVAQQMEYQATSRERIATLVAELGHAERTRDRLGERIDDLRAEVQRLGGDVDEINRVGKRGQPGDKGPTGDKGAPGAAAS